MTEPDLELPHVLNADELPGVYDGVKMARVGGLKEDGGTVYLMRIRYKTYNIESGQAGFVELMVPIEDLADFFNEQITLLRDFGIASRTKLDSEG